MLYILPTNCHFSVTLVQYYCTLIINMLYHLQVTSTPVCWQFCWLLWRDLASQMWCLGRFLPLIIGSHMPEDDEKCCLFPTLLIKSWHHFCWGDHHWQISFLKRFNYRPPQQICPVITRLLSHPQEALYSSLLEDNDKVSWKCNWFSLFFSFKQILNDGVMIIENKLQWSA